MPPAAASERGPARGASAAGGRRLGFLGRHAVLLALLAVPATLVWAWAEVSLGIMAFYHPNDPIYDAGGSLPLALGAAVLSLALAAAFALGRRRIAPRLRARVLVGAAALVAVGHAAILVTTPRIRDTFVRTFDGAAYAIPSTHTTIPGDGEGRVQIDVCQTTGAGIYERDHRADGCRPQQVTLRAGDVSALGASVALKEIGGTIDGGTLTLLDLPPSGGVVAGWAVAPMSGSDARHALRMAKLDRRVMLEYEDGGRLVRVADCNAGFGLCRVSRTRGAGLLEYEFEGPIPTSPEPFDAFERRIEGWLQGWRVGPRADTAA